MSNKKRKRKSRCRAKRHILDKIDGYVKCHRYGGIMVRIEGGKCTHEKCHLSPAFVLAEPVATA